MYIYLPFLYGIVVIVCTYQGAELVGIAAGESEDPENNVKRAIRNVGIRICYFCSVCIYCFFINAWQQASVSNSPFIAILQQVKIPISIRLCSLSLLLLVSPPLILLFMHVLAYMVDGWFSTSSSFICSHKQKMKFHIMVF